MVAAAHDENSAWVGDDRDRHGGPLGWQRKAARLVALHPRASDGVDTIAEVALGADLDRAALRFLGAISTCANDGGKPIDLDARRTTALNTRLQFPVYYAAGTRCGRRGP